MLTVIGVGSTTVVETADQTLDALRAQSYDLVMLDVHLPGSINGYRIAHRISNRKRPETTGTPSLRQSWSPPVIIMTADAPSPLSPMGEFASVQAFLSKPFTLASLRRAIAEAVAWDSNSATNKHSMRPCASREHFRKVPTAPSLSAGSTPSLGSPTSIGSPIGSPQAARPLRLEPLLEIANRFPSFAHLPTPLSPKTPPRRLLRSQSELPPCRWTARAENQENISTS